MQDALITVVVVVAAVSGVVAIFTLLASGRLWDSIGSHGIERDPASPGHSDSAGEREQEIKELLEARSALRERHGAEPLQLDEELETLLAPVPDESLRADARALVEARNRRRVRDGLPELDVEAEIDRQLRGLT